MEASYCLAADLLGFSKMMANLGGAARRERVDEWAQLVARCAREAEVEPDRWQFVSDSLFAGEPATAEGLRRLIHFARLLLNQGFPLSLPIRAGIAMGEAEWQDPFAYGPGIVDAYRLCESQTWVGGSCAAGLPHLDGLWSRDQGLVAYAVPMKAGPVQVRPAIVWDIPAGAALTKSLASRGLAREGETLQWQWANLVQNTLLFRIYLEVLPKAESIEVFHGFFPAQAIAAALRIDDALTF